MTPPRNAILQGDVMERLAELPAASVHAVVTDPPYGLHFMGKSWDKFGSAVGRDHKTTSERSGSMHAGFYDDRRNGEYRETMEAIFVECLRVLKPGGHLVSFGGTRTFHRLWCAAEDAGFEVRDTLCWLYGQGFPKSYNVAQSLQKIADTGNARRPDRDLGGLSRDRFSGSTSGQLIADTGGPVDITNAAAAQWEGWGTALKPGWEPILLARAPFRGTVAGNVLAHGTGALNVGACRIEVNSGRPSRSNAESASGLTGKGNAVTFGRFAVRGSIATGQTQAGRWPANVALDAEAAALLDAQSGRLVSGMMAAGQRRNASKGRGGWFGGCADEATAAGTYGDTGGASRFFYCAKAGRGEREAGLREAGVGALRDGGRGEPARNHHPTVKPIALMRWLVRMVTPPGGLVLDPFAGSGTTLCAAAAEGFAWLGIEAEADYVAIARARVAHWAKVGPRLRRLEALRQRTEQVGPEVAASEAAEAAGQTRLFEE